MLTCGLDNVLGQHGKSDSRKEEQEQTRQDMSLRQTGKRYISPNALKSHVEMGKTGTKNGRKKERKPSRMFVGRSAVNGDWPMGEEEDQEAEHEVEVKYRYLQFPSVSRQGAERGFCK